MAASNLPNKMKIFDTTLRDGTQSPNVNLSVRDKLDIVQALDHFGVDYIELGWPGANDKELEAFLEAKKIKLKHSKIVAFGSTKRIDLKAKDDPNLQAILKSKAPVACIFGKTWIEHVKSQLKATPEQNLKAIGDSIKFLKSKKKEVIYDCEHFFDGFKDNRKYALDCVKTAIMSGADFVVLCDTNGGTLVTQVQEIMSDVKEFLSRNKLQTNLGVHFHNDSGVAVANSLVSTDYDCKMIQGTINGFGERTGNADLCQILPSLVLKKGYPLKQIKLKNILEISNLVYTLANIKPNKSQAYVGKNAFRHKGGIHVDALMKGATYEHIDPAHIGSERGIVLSDLSGKANIVEVLRKFKLKVDKNDPNVKSMLKKVERLEKKGYDIGSIPAEQFLLKEEYFGKKGKIFKIDSWKIVSEQSNGERSECTLKGEVKSHKTEVVAAVDGGPVDSVYLALTKLIETRIPQIKGVDLVNYKVMIAQDQGAESSVRVFIEFTHKDQEWGTVGVSTNILEASIEAIEKGFRYFLLKHL